MTREIDQKNRQTREEVQTDREEKKIRYSGRQEREIRQKEIDRDRQKEIDRDRQTRERYHRWRFYAHLHITIKTTLMIQNGHRA